MRAALEEAVASGREVPLIRGALLDGAPWTGEAPAADFADDFSEEEIEDFAPLLAAATGAAARDAPTAEDFALGTGELAWLVVIFCCAAALRARRLGLAT